MKVVGKELYESDFEGKHYSGIRFYITDQKVGVEGFLTDVVKVPSTKPRFQEICAIPLGVDIVPIYNRYGRVEDINVLSVKK